MNAIRFSGPRWFQFRALLTLIMVSVRTLIRRAVKGSRYPSWSTTLEIMTAYMSQLEWDISRLPTPQQQRQYADALIIVSPALAKVRINPIDPGKIKGHWVVPCDSQPKITILYLHGGGYAFYSRAHENLIAYVTLAANARTFALDYPLTPEYPFPAQQQCALDAYRWMLESGIDPQHLVVVGDSAGGNLALSLLLALRDSQIPMPALTVGLCPWVDITCSGSSMSTNEASDWIAKQMAVQWGKWFSEGSDPNAPMLSPIHADLRGLSPLYIQAGGGEILIDQIREFVARARQQGAVIHYDEWEDMPHDFQAYGETLTQAGEALTALATVIQKQTTEYPIHAY